MFSFLFLSLAYAVPLQFHHQGRLLDIDGVPVVGQHDMIFRIYDDATEGDVQWEESLTVEFSNGFYAVSLGQDEANNPLDDSILMNHPLWLALTVDDDTMEPRQPIQSVPYAQMASVTENLRGGTVDASDISVAGSAVIDEQGVWVGEAINWSDVADIPADLLDGDNDSQLSETEVEGYVTNGAIDLAANTTIDGLDILTTDSDSLGALSCTNDGDIPHWDSIVGWYCDVDMDTWLSEAEVEDYVTNAAIDLYDGSTVAGNTILTTATTLAPDWIDVKNRPAGLDDGDDDTQLTATEVQTIVEQAASLTLAADATVEGNSILTSATTLSPDWSNLQNRPAGLDDGDDDTQLTSTEVKAMVELFVSLNLPASTTVAGNTILTSATTLAPDWSDVRNRPAGLDDGDDNTQLSATEVQAMIELFTALDLPAQTTIDGRDVVTLTAANCTQGQLPKWNASAQIWNCQDDEYNTINSTDVINAIENNGLQATAQICDSNGCIGENPWNTSGSDLYYENGNVGIGTQTPSSTLEVNGQIHTTSGGIRFPDNTLQSTAATGNGYVFVWSYKDGTTHNDFTTSFLWGDWIKDRISEGSLSHASLYQCNMLSDNGAHYTGISFKIATNLNAPNYEDHHRVFDIEETNSGWVGGCGASIHSYSEGVNNAGGFSYTNSCTQTITCRCVKLN